MSYRAWVYIGSILLFAAGLSTLALTGATWATFPWLPFAILTVLATLAQIFKAEGPNHVAFFATPVFLFAGVLLLPPHGFVLLVAVPHLVEWLKARLDDTAHLRAWYIQPFNIAKHIIAGSAALFVQSVVTTAIAPILAPPAIVGLLSMATTYLLVNELLLGQALVLARGQSWRELGILNGENLLPEFIMLCVGVSLARFWTVDPWLTLPALAPLVLMYRALTIPKLKEAAQTDGKTGLYNAEHFTTLFAGELQRSKRFNRPLALIMADLDLLRNINNTYGHLAGDLVLAGIGELIRKTIREYDVAGRFGGEEFAIMMPEADVLQAQQLAERLRLVIEEASFTVSTSTTPIHVTISLGVACFPQDAATQTDLVHEADVAVYQAKFQGRNRVLLAAEVPHSITLESIAPVDRQVISYPAAFARRTIDAGMGITDTTAARVITDHAQASPADGHAAIAGNSTPHVARDTPPPPDPPRRTTQGHASTHSTPPANTSLPAPLAVFVGGVIAVGALVTTLGWAVSPPLDVLTLSLLIVLAMIAELWQISVYGDNSMSVSLAIIIAAAFTAGMPGVALVSGAIALADQLRQRRAPKDLYKVAFNWATHVLAGTVGVLVISAPAVAMEPTNLLQLAILTTIVTVAYYGIDTGLISIAISLAKRANALTTWQTQFRWLAGHYFVLGFMGLFLSIASTALGLLGILVFTLPVIMMRYAQWQYVERTQASVRETKRMNEELAQANREIVGASQAIQQVNDELFETLAQFLDARDPYVGGHAVKVGDYATAIARELGLTGARLKQVRQAGLLHDIGKIAIPEQILHKPSKLTNEEYAIIKTHVTIGADLLEPSQGLRHLAPFVRYHHERWDGRGYPAGLHGEDIPLEARILNVCDSVEAMASDRPYHKGMTLSEIIAEVKRCAGTQFDPTVAQVFIRLVEREGEQFIVNSAREVDRKQAGQREVLSDADAEFSVQPQAASLQMVLRSISKRVQAA